MNRGIFREYDIRGVVATDLTPDVVENIGKALGTMVRRNGGTTVAVGKDARTSSDSLFASLTAGIVSTGCAVFDIGLVPTPLLYYAVYELAAGGGCMITGSHNPPEFNGFKMNLGSGSLYGDKIRLMLAMIESGDFDVAETPGRIEEKDVVTPYTTMVMSKITLKRPVKIVMDAGNGCGGVLAPRLMRDLGAEVIELYCDVDGTFPNHHPDPTVPENLTDLIAKVRQTGADAGIAYDGDADRIGVVDEKGNILFGDQILMIFARDILSKKPGSKIVFDVKCSQNLVDDIIKHGGVPLINPTGHSLIKARLAAEGAELAGEMSAHIFFNDEYYGFDDAVYATARLLRIMAATDKPVSEYLADLPPLVNTPEIRVDCPDDEKFALVASLVKEFKADGYDVVDLDGARVSMEGGWGLVRASNTQPVLVLRFEAKTPVRLDEIRRIFLEKLKRFPATAGLRSL